MTITEALQDWRELAIAAAELNALRRRVAQVEEEHDTARTAFEKEIERLEDPDREAILAIMSVYDANNADAEGSSRGEESKSDVLRWLLNKVGNEGISGMRWGDLLDLWKKQFPDRSTTVLYGVFHTHCELFEREGDRKEAVLKLTPKGHAVFLN